MKKLILVLFILISFQATAQLPNLGGLNGIKNGSLVKAVNNPKIYLLENGKLRSFPDVNSLNCIYPNGTNRVINTSQAVIDKIPKGEPMPSLKNSSLIALIGTTDYFVVNDCTKTAISQSELTPYGGVSSVQFLSQLDFNRVKTSIQVTGGGGAPPTTTDNKTAINNYLKQIGTPQLIVRSPVVSKGTTDLPNGLTGNTETIEYQKRLENFVIMGANVTGMYPGSLVQTSSLKSDGLNIVGVKAGKGTLSITGLNSNNTNGVGEIIQSPTIQNTTDAINRIYNRINPSNSPLNAIVQYCKVRNFNQFLVNLGVKYSDTNLKTSANINFSDTYEKSTIVLSIIQPFYQVNWEPDRSTGSIYPFDESVTLSQLTNYCGPGNAPGYVSQVTYGRMIFIILESQGSMQELEAVVKAAYKSPGNDLSAELDIKYKSVLESLSAKYVISGGTSTVWQSLPDPFNYKTPGNFQDGISKLMDPSQSQPSLSNRGTPISFSVYYCSGGVKAGSISTAKYTDLVSVPPVNSRPDVYYFKEGNPKTRVGNNFVGQPVNTGVLDIPIFYSYGDMVTINAEGGINTGLWGWSDPDPNGYYDWNRKGERIWDNPGIPEPKKAPYCGLIGKIGNGPWQFVGTGSTTIVCNDQTTGSASLLLQSNDNILDNGSKDPKYNWKITVVTSKRVPPGTGSTDSGMVNLL